MVFVMSIVVMFMVAFLVMILTPITEMFEHTVGSFFPFVVVTELASIPETPFIVMAVLGVMSVHVVMCVFTCVFLNIYDIYFIFDSMDTYLFSKSIIYLLMH